MIKEAKEILKAYIKVPLSEIPEEDREKFGLAYVVLQSAWGAEKFKQWVKENG